MAIDWSDIYSKKVRAGFREALSDKQLTHAEVVEILRSVLLDGELEGAEVNDLQKIAHSSETMPDRSKNLLLNLANTVYENRGYGPIWFSTVRQKYAVVIVSDFLKRSGSGSFRGLDRDRVGIDLLLRVANPNIIRQGQAGLCGPVSFLYTLAFDSPNRYANFGCEMFEKGTAKLGQIDISPGSDCRSYSPPSWLSHGDWVTAASLRDSENFFRDYDDVGKMKAASTTNKELAAWFEKAGYTDVRADDNRSTSREASDITMINKLFNDGYRVILRINAMLLDKATQNDKSSRGNHFVILRSPISVAGNLVHLTVFTWGVGQWNIPAPNTTMSPGGFLEHWYGYVAAKPY